MESFRSSSKDRLVEAEDFLPLLGTDHIEFYCGNAKQSAFIINTCLGLNW